MSTAMAMQAHIAYELIEETNHQLVIVEFLSHDITSPAQARELAEQLHSLLRRQSRQYFVIDCAGVRALGSTAFGEILSFVQIARPVWVCNLDRTLRLGASLVGLDNSVRYSANRRAAIKDAEHAIRSDDQDTEDYPVWPH